MRARQPSPGAASGSARAPNHQDHADHQPADQRHGRQSHPPTAPAQPFRRFFGHALDPLQRAVGRGRQRNLDGVPRSHDAGDHDHRHDAGLAHDSTGSVSRGDGSEKPGPMRLDLATRIAQAGEAHQRASEPSRSRVPAGSARRSTPRVVTFSPRLPGATSKPSPRSSSNSSLCSRWTWRRLGCVGSAATRERWRTAAPKCASPSTPSPATQPDLLARLLAERVARAAMDVGNVGGGHGGTLREAPRSAHRRHRRAETVKA